MKELTIQEKASRYDEAIEKAKKHYEECKMRGNDWFVEDMEDMFPELVESDDEKIRKDLLYFLNAHIGCSIAPAFCTRDIIKWVAWLEKLEVEHIKLELKAGNSYFCYKSRWERADNETFKKGLIYKCNKDGVLDNFVIKNPEQHFIEIKDERIILLEKQDEQKSTDNIEPKFNVRDKIKLAKEPKYPAREIIAIKNDAYYFDELVHLPFNRQDEWELVEQKTVEKVEPKFHERDWIIHNKNNELANSLMLVTGKDNNKYLCKYKDGQCSYNIEFIDKEYRLWTIEDAKDGDIIYSKHNTESFEWIGIFKSLDKENKRVFFYGFWHDMAKTFSVCMNEAYVLYDDFTPATKEQRDLLFQKMKEAGYEWNAKKKELKKIEQKQVINYPDNLPKDNWELIHEFVNKFGRIPKDEDELNVLVEYVLKRQNSTWSEEDEDKMETICFHLTDELDTIGCYRTKDLVNFLKSLKERYTWKPSEEQIQAIRLAITFVTDDFSDNPTLSEILIGLEEQLNKLSRNSYESK